MRELQLQVRRIYILLGEVLDLSQQMAQTADRGDEISLQILMDMREEPLQKLKATRTALESRCRELRTMEGGVHLVEVLRGASPRTPEEEPLAQLIAQTGQLLQRTLDTDRRVSQKVTGAQSYYHQ